MAAGGRDADYAKVAAAIKEHGEANPSFPADTDIEFGKLKTICQSVNGLQTILKNMKQKKQVDFGAQGMFKDNDIISLIGDYEAEAVSLQQTVDDVPEEKTSHQKTAGW